MSAYIETLTIEAADAATPEDIAFYTEGASRLFDLLCEVEPEFFNAAQISDSGVDESGDVEIIGESDDLNIKTFDGNGIDMLRLPPFVGDVSVTIDGIVLSVDKYKIKNGYLYYKDNIFDEDALIAVSANWGFATIPADIKMVVQELANYLWRQKDPMLAENSGTEIERQLSPTINAVIKKYRDKYSQGVF